MERIQDQNEWISIKRKGVHQEVKIHQQGALCWLSFKKLDQLCGFVNGFSTRLGGVSENHLYSMNLSFARGDEEENVRENYKRIASAIGFSPEQMVFTDQTHTTNIRKVTSDDCGKGFIKERDYHDIDGLITNEPGIVLTTFYADCVPIYLIDPKKRAIGLSHSGWRGTVGKIGQVTIQKMQEAYGCDPADMIAAIGPSICQDCYEVSEEVILQFQNGFQEKYWTELYEKKENGKYQLNLWRANEIILEEAGIRKECIATTYICTGCNPRLLYSHRASMGKRGNLAAFLMIQ